MKPAEVAEATRDLFIIIDSNAEQLRKVTESIEEGFGRPALDSTLPNEQSQEALKRLKTGKTRGEVVLNLDASYGCVILTAILTFIYRKAFSRVT